MADESKLYSKEGFPDRLFTDAQYNNLGEGADGWKRKRKPTTPSEVNPDKTKTVPDADPKVSTTAKEAAATDIPGQSAQTAANDGNQPGAQTTQTIGTDGDGKDPQTAGSLPKPAHEKVVEPKKNG